MSTRILDALSGKTKPLSVLFADLGVGQPFKWVEEDASARRGVCIKVEMVTGKFGFSSGEENYGWTSLETEWAGTIYSNAAMPKEVIPL